MEVGVTRTIKQSLNRKRCEFDDYDFGKESINCEKPATHRLTYLRSGARGDPQSTAFHRDDCSRCSDQDVFVCDEHKKYKYKIEKKLGLVWCTSFNYGERYKHMFEWWEDMK